MDHDQFDDLSKALVTQGTRRGAIGLMAGLLGLGVAGADVDAESKQKRRRRRRRNKQDRRKPPTWPYRGIKILLENPLEREVAATVEFGYGVGLATLANKHPCCQGQSAYTLQPGEFEEYTTEESEGYAWIDGKYFINFLNTTVALPPAIWSSVGGAADIYQGDCCKAGGSRGSSFNPLEGQTRVLDLQGRVFVILRLDDESKYKVYLVRMM